MQKRLSVPEGGVRTGMRAGGDYGGGDDIVEVLNSDELEEDERGDAAIELLSRLNHGYPAINLRRLIHSNNERVVSTGAWLISEIGAKAAEIPAEVYEDNGRLRLTIYNREGGIAWEYDVAEFIEALGKAIATVGR